MKSTLAAILVLSSLAVGAVAWTRAPQSAVLLGSIELKGGVEKRSVSTSAIPNPPGAGPEMVGTLVNKTGATMGDVTVEVKRKSSSNSAPSGGSTKFDQNGTVQQSTNHTSTADGVKSNTDFQPAGGVDPVHNQGVVDVELDLTSVGNGAEIEVWFTPSRLTPTGHADVMTAMELSTQSPSVTSSLDGGYHPLSVMLVTNLMRSSSPIVAFTGQVRFASAPGVGLAGVELTAVGGAALSGAQVSVQGNQFTITGFRPLRPGTSYELFVRLAAAPTSGYTVELTAQFE